MPTETETRMTIHRVGAEPIRIVAELTPFKSRNMGSAIEEGMKSNYLGIELEGKLIIVPTHQIASIEIEPAPQMEIAYVIRGARRAKE